jgi:hypothetical protein
VIVDNPLILNITAGAGRSIPETGDNQVVIPATMSPVVSPCQPHLLYSASAGLQGANLSFFNTIVVQRNNQAQVNTQILILPKGLYEIDVYLASKFNFTPAAAGTVGAEVVMFIGPAGANASTIVISRWAFTGSFTDTMRFRLMANDELRFDLRVGITGAAEFADARVGLNAVRIL